MTNKLNRKLAPLTVSLLLGGCSLMPIYERPISPAPAEWPKTTAPSPRDQHAIGAAKLEWQKYFSDATLKQLIDIALTNNRDLRVAVLNIEQARAQLGIRRADQLPTLNAAASGSRAPNSSGGSSTSYSAGLLVTAYELDFFGRVASLKEQALAQYLATQEGSQTVKISLIATVAQSWLGLLADEELLTLTRQTLSTREESLKLVALRLQYGAASGLEESLAKSLLESTRVTLAQQQRQRALDENALALLLGQSIPKPLRTQLENRSLNQVQLPELASGLPSDLLIQRPDIRQAEQLLIASNANIGAARAAFFPRISLTAGAGSASSELGALFSNGSWGVTLAPQLLFPFFDAGRNQAALDSAQTGRKIAIAQYEKAIQSAFREVADALAERETLNQQLHAQQSQLEAESTRVRLTNLRLQNGAASQLDWLDAQRSLFGAQQAMVQTRLAYLQNQISLYKTLGGGARTYPGETRVN